MGNEVAKRRIFEHMKKLQSISWPGESSFQVAERLARFAGKCPDTECFVPGIKEFWPLFLEQVNDKLPAVSEVGDWLCGLVAELMLADDDDDEALLIALTQIYYYCIDPKLTLSSGYEYGITGTMAGHFLRCENQSIRDLIHEVVDEIFWVIPSYSLFPLCVVHSAIETKHSGCTRTIDLLQKRCRDSLIENERTRGFDVTIGMENFSSDLLRGIQTFSFDLWWRGMNYVSPLNDYKVQVREAVDAFTKDCKAWLTDN